MQPVRRLPVVALILLAILFPSVATASDPALAVINGNVRDATGAPVVGALVIVASSGASIDGHMALTDKRGWFSIPDLFPGKYSVKVTMPTFLPVFKDGIELNPGNHAILTVNLQNALDIVRRTLSRDKGYSEDIMWTLRSSRTSQPVLRLVDKSSDHGDSYQPTEYSGYFQLYSKSIETSSGAEEGVGSQFSLTMPLDTKSQFTLEGKYSELPTQSRGFGAKYQFSPADRHRTAIGVNVRQGALFGDPINVQPLREVQLDYGEDFQWSDHLVFNYGAEVGRADAVSDRNYLRPRLTVSWVPDVRTTFTVNATSQAPSAADDPIRGNDYFDRTLFVPPAMERYAHGEITASRIVNDNLDLSAAVFSDRTDTQALFVGTADGRRGVLLFDTSRTPFHGLRFQINRQFKNFEAGVGYTTATGLTFQNRDAAFDDLRNQLARRQFHIVTARFKAEIDMTQTEVTAMYRWMSDVAATRVDPYQRLVEYNDPTLSLTVAQNLPSWRMFPGKVQAILDARNLFEHSFGPQNTQAAQYPRLVKGGINIKF